MKLLRVLVVLCALACWVALALIYYEVESVLGTGPVVLVLGFVTFWFARKLNWRIAALGVLHMLVAFIFFWCVQLFSWSPSEAEEPFRWMGRAYAAGWTFAAIMILRPTKEERAPELRASLGHVAEKSR